MIEKKTVSQCITSDYCKGWNDAVDSIVRCKECKYMHHSTAFVTGRYCRLRNVNGGRFCKDNDFCSYGERRTDNE